MISVFGNGESRRNIDISAVNHTTIGCNAIHRDYFVDHLICVDRRMVQEALDSKFLGKIYTRSDWIPFFKNKNLELVPELPYKGTDRPDDPFQWGSGPYAVLLAAKLDSDVHLYGFDLFSQTRFLNNIYKDTANYNSSSKPATDPRYWIYQISKVFQSFPDKYFTVYNTADWQLPDSWRLENVSFKILDSDKQVL